MPFALWKQPDLLPNALAEVLAIFPKTTELAITMTGELCDCFETKAEGVARILASVRAASGQMPVRIWSTSGDFVSPEIAVEHPLLVAAANWHALATWVCHWVPAGLALLLDIGSTTTDIIPLYDGHVASRGRTDPERLRFQELVYTGVRRTPICALLKPGEGAAEFFATTLDVHLLLQNIAENAVATDTADSRPETRYHAHARLSRMFCSDPVLTKPEDTLRFAREIADRQLSIIRDAVEQQPEVSVIITSGSGEFLARQAIAPTIDLFTHHLSLGELLGPEIAACAPAYAVAMLAEARPI